MTRTCHATISRSLLRPHLVGRERRLPPDLVDVAPVPVAHEHVPHAHAGRYLIVADRYTRPNAGRPTRLRRTSHLARAVSTSTIVAARQMRFHERAMGRLKDTCLSCCLCREASPLSPFLSSRDTRAASRDDGSPRRLLGSSADCPRKLRGAQRSRSLRARACRARELTSSIASSPPTVILYGYIYIICIYITAHLEHRELAAHL